jgi:hypothetical protein
VRAVMCGDRGVATVFFLELKKIHCPLRFGREERGGGGEETTVEERGVVAEVEGCANGDARR